MSSLFQSRAQVAQAEFARKYPRGTFLPYVHEAFDTLPKRIADLCDEGKPREAECDLLQAENAAGVIDYWYMNKRILQLEEPDENGVRQP